MSWSKDYHKKWCNSQCDPPGCTTWGRRVFLLHQRLLWTVWQRCPGLADGKCPPRSARVLRWTPHTSAPGWAPFQAQTAAHTLQCLSGFSQTLQISRKAGLSTIQVVFITRRDTEAISTFTMVARDSVMICASRKILKWKFVIIIDENGEFEVKQQ